MTSDNYKHNCYFGSCFKHTFHSIDNSQHNSLVDLVINLAESLEQGNKKYLISQENLYRELGKIKSSLNKLLENQDYIKEQNNLLLNKLKILENKKPSDSIKILEKLNNLEKIILS